MRLWRRRWTRTLALAVAVCLASGCGQEGDEAGTAKSKPGEVAAESQRPGDAQAGYDALVNQAVVTCGVPYSAFTASVGHADPSLRLPGRTGRNAELPYMVTAFTSRSGVELVTANCLTCHAATLEGELVLGLGNEFLDFTADPAVAAEAVGARVKGRAGALEWRKWADRIGTIAPYMTTDTVGVNPAGNLILALLAHRDPVTLAWSDQPLMEPPPRKPLPVSVPPWWNLGKKHALFYNAQGRGDHARLMALAATACTGTLEEAKELDARFTDVRAYLASLRPPRYPFAIEEGLAARGRRLFVANCKPCHGTYGEGGHYPNRVIGLEEIGTDPAFAETAYKDNDRFLDWFKRSYFGATARIVPTLGYLAPPLDGVWATAPYLHNGSVPTIEALLDSSRRPLYWRHDAGGPDYDRQTLGWAYAAVPYGKDGAMSWDERNRIYDTSLRGYGNQGHTFGDELTAAERSALLEYLKTL